MCRLQLSLEMTCGVMEICLDALRERVGILDSEKTEVERQFGQLKEQGLEEGMVTQEAAMKELKNELTSLKNQRSKLEQDLHHCRSRAQALQVELDNSEAVQRDFVKLSQSLQASTVLDSL